MPLRRTAVVGCLFVCTIVSAQDTAPPASTSTADSNVPPVSVILKLKDDKPLHFGETIQLELQYMATRRGYVRVGSTNKVVGYHPWRIECQPEEQRIDRRKNTGAISAQEFYFSKPNCRAGFGSGGGVGGGCFDCENELGTQPVSFPIVLNNEIQFLQPGH